MGDPTVAMGPTVATDRITVEVYSSYGPYCSY